METCDTADLEVCGTALPPALDRAGSPVQVSSCISPKRGPCSRRRLQSSFDSAKQVGRGVGFGLAVGFCRQFKGSGGAQFFLREGRAGADFFKQASLRRFEVHEAAEHVEDVDQFGGVFGQPMTGLEVAQGRGRAAWISFSGRVLQIGRADGARTGKK